MCVWLGTIYMYRTTVQGGEKKKKKNQGTPPLDDVSEATFTCVVLYFFNFFFFPSLTYSTQAVVFAKESREPKLIHAIKCKCMRNTNTVR